MPENSQNPQVALYMKVTDIYPPPEKITDVFTKKKRIADVLKLVDDLAVGKSQDDLIVALNMNIQADLYPVVERIVHIINDPQQLSKATLLNNKLNERGIGLSLLHTAWLADQKNRDRNEYKPETSLFQLLIKNGVRVLDADVQNYHDLDPKFMAAYNSAVSGKPSEPENHPTNR